MTARMIVKESEEVTKMAKKVAAVCTDKRMKMVSHLQGIYYCVFIHHMSIQALLQIVDKLPTIGTQLKIIASVKATTQGGDGKQFQFVYCQLHMRLNIPYGTKLFCNVL